MPVKSTGRGQRDRIRAVLSEIEKKELKIGFFENSRYEDGTPVAYVAAIQEFGYPEGNIPARPFMRPTVEQQRAAWRQSLLRGAKAVINDRITLENMLSQLGAQAAGQVSGTIRSISEPPLADTTVAARESRRRTPGVSTKPLVDTGLMIQSVTYEVVDR